MSAGVNKKSRVRVLACRVRCFGDRVEVVSGFGVWACWPRGLRVPVLGTELLKQTCKPQMGCGTGRWFVLVLAGYLARFHTSMSPHGKNSEMGATVNTPYMGIL